MNKEYTIHLLHVNAYSYNYYVYYEEMGTLSVWSLFFYTVTEEVILVISLNSWYLYIYAQFEGLMSSNVPTWSLWSEVFI